jgi:hypothetical protein
MKAKNNKGVQQTDFKFFFEDNIQDIYFLVSDAENVVYKPSGNIAV